jgi:hypothetical protein
VLVACGLLLVPAGAWAGRPLDTEDTGTLDPGKAELELSADHAGNPEDTTWSLKGVFAVGLLPRLEARIESAFLFLDPDEGKTVEGIGDSLIGIKYRLLDETETRPALLGGLTLRLPTGDDARGLGAEDVDIGILAVVSKSLDPVTANGNVGYTVVTQDGGLNFWSLNGSIEYRVTAAWSLVGEVVSALGASRAEDTVVFRVGSVYAITERLKLDGALGFGLTSESPDLLATFGVTLGLF